MKFNIIGAGRLGKNIALALSANQIANAEAVCNRQLSSTEQAIKQIGTGVAIASLTDLPEVDITWITSNDDAIESIISSLKVKPGSMVIHCSGVLSSAILAPLRAQGCSIASFHPLKAFRFDYLDAKAFHRVDCVIEGDVQATDWLKTTFEALGAHIINIKPEAKAKYHAGATIASNYLLSLAAQSEALFIQAGIDQYDARTIICNLMRGNIQNLGDMQPISLSLTGPLMRGDIKTLELHLAHIGDPETIRLYKTAGLALLPLTQLSEEQKGVIRGMLGE